VKSYCIKPFSTVYLGADKKDHTIDIAPCCLYQSEQKYTSATQWLQSQELHDLQQHLLTQQQLPAGCIKCHQDEMQGISSLRLKHTPHCQPIEVTQITDLEIFPGNACNLSCVFCGPSVSTGVGQEHKKLGWIKQVPVIDTVQQSLQTMQVLPDLTSVGIIGGEFFVTKNNLEILDQAIKQQLRFRIVTNATCLTPQHFDKLACISDLDITVSIDGTGSVYEFLRYPANWHTTTDNIKQLKRRLPQAKLHILTVLQPLAVQHLANLFDWANRELLSIAVMNIEEVEWLSWPILNPAECSQLATQLKHDITGKRLTSKQKDVLTHVAALLQNNQHQPNSRALFVSKISQLIAARKTDTDVVNTLFGTLTNLRDQIWYHLRDSNSPPLRS